MNVKNIKKSFNNKFASREMDCDQMVWIRKNLSYFIFGDITFKYTYLSLCIL